MGALKGKGYIALLNAVVAEHMCKQFKYICVQKALCFRNTNAGHLQLLIGLHSDTGVCCRCSEGLCLEVYLVPLVLKVQNAEVVIGPDIGIRMKSGL